MLVRMIGPYRALVLAALLAACGDGPTSTPAPTPTASRPAPVEVQLVEARTMPLSVPIVASGTMAALQTSAIGALVEGPVERIYVRVGDRVRKGQPLLRVRPADYERRVAEAAAAQRLGQAQFDQAERALARITELSGRGFAPKARLEEAQLARDVARAQRDQAAAVLATARQALADTTVRAPFDGVVTARLVDEGVYLNNRFSMGGQSAALQLQELRVVAAIVSVPEAHGADLRLNLPAKLAIEGVPAPVASYVAIINDRVDPATRMIEVRLPARNADYSIKTGVSVRAEITRDPVEAVVLPRRAVAGDSAQPYVFVALGGRAVRTPVRIADVDLDRVRIIAGLEAGHAVVDRPPSTLVDGAEIRPASDRVMSRAAHVAR
jgi:membrane fusion protein, multidrug efflux system